MDGPTVATFDFESPALDELSLKFSTSINISFNII